MSNILAPKETRTEDAIKRLIAERIKALRGPRPMEIMAEKMGCSRQRVSQIEAGDVSESWLYLSRLRDSEGIDLNALLTARENGR